MRLRPLVLSLSIALATLGGRIRTADACGGCLVPPNEVTVVNAHRMAFAITPTQTVLWDQIRYSGDPREFAWVLPVRAGARVELSRDEWFAALDASTQPVVIFPSSGAYGCALAGCSAGGSSATSFDDTVHVLSQSVVGPYETVTLRSTNPSALVTWLDVHGFVLPATIRPVVDAYVSEGFDFIALRLRPQCSERSMKPVRVVTPGADPKLPLRMVAAGVGANVDILLYVIGEGRWRPKNFSEVLFDDSQLQSTGYGVSNYEPLAQGLMAQHGHTSWLTEAASQPDLAGWYPGHPDLSGTSANAPVFNAATSAGAPNPGLAATYFAFCHGTTIVPGSRSTISTPAPCSSDAGIDSGGDDASDAASDGANASLDDAGFNAIAEAASEAAADAATRADVGVVVDAGMSILADADDASFDFDAMATDARDFDATAVVDAPNGVVADGAGEAGAEDAHDAAKELDAADAGDEASLAQTTPIAGDSGGKYTPVYPSVPNRCADFDDIDVALAGAHFQDVWVTRMRANLPVFALANDLLLEASPTQSIVSNVHLVPAQPAVRSRQGCAAGSRPQGDAFSTGALVAVTVFGVGATMRRRRRG